MDRDGGFVDTDAATDRNVRAVSLSSFEKVAKDDDDAAGGVAEEGSWGAIVERKFRQEAPKLLARSATGVQSETLWSLVVAVPTVGGSFLLAAGIKLI